MSISDCNNGTLGMLLGNGDGTFDTAVTYNSGGYTPLSVAVGDVTGDGKPDLIVMNYCVGGTNGSCSEGFDGVVGALIGNGDGTFQTAVTYDSGGQIGRFVAIGDVNGDAKPDLVVANVCGNTVSICDQSMGVGVLINVSIDSTTTAVASSPNPSSVGQSVTFTATVTGQGFYKGTPTGTVTFYDGTSNLGGTTLNSVGVGTLSISTLPVGTHSITVTYSGDANFAPSTSLVLSQIVQGAIITISPTSLSFGTQSIGITSSPQNVTITDIGNINLTNTIGITGANAADFAQTNNCPSSVPPNTSCTITVMFTPTATGSRAAAVSITDNAPGSPQSIALTGVGVSPTVTLSPTSLNFPDQTIFTTSKAQVVTLTNNGLGILSISSISATSPFSQTNTCGATVNPGASCTISVTFTPKTKGTLTGKVSIIDNAPGSPQTVSLKGTGTDILLSPTGVNFGTQPVGTTSLAKRITLTNKASVTVSITAISITGLNASDFAQTNTCGTSVPGGGSCFIKVTFTPSARGKRSASVSVTDNGGGSPQKVSLVGTGT